MYSGERMKSCLLSTLVLLLLGLCTTAQAQFPPLRFVFEPGPDPLFSRYSWRIFVTQDDFLSPGGTFITNTFQRAEFETFQEFLDDVVGVWLVQGNNGVGSFEILTLQESDFEPLQLLSPATGKQLYSGQKFDIIVEPDDPNESGISFFSPDPDVECQCVGDIGQIVMPPDLAETTGRFSSFDTEDRDDLITSSQGDIIVSAVTMVSLTERAELFVLAAILGDTNFDGEVNLLDVTSFVELLTSGEYLFQADVNQDGVVDLLDVGPFIKLLTG